MMPSGKFVVPDFLLVCGTKVASAGPETHEMNTMASITCIGTRLSLSFSLSLPEDVILIPLCQNLPSRC